MSDFYEKEREKSKWIRKGIKRERERIIRWIKSTKCYTLGHILDSDLDALSEKQVNSQQTKTTIVRNGTNPELVEDEDGDNAIVNASLKKDKTADTRKGCGKFVGDYTCGNYGFFCKKCSQNTEKRLKK